jgi:hypothetical protein
MRSLWLFLAVVAVTCSWAGAADEEEEDQCGLYLATSSTSTADEPKWGTFAGKPYKTRSPIGFGDVAIHTHHMEANAFSGDFEQEYLTNIVDFFENFIWV